MQMQNLNSLKMEDIPMAQSALFDLSTSPEVNDEGKAFINSHQESQPNIHKSSGKIELNNSSSRKLNEDEDYDRIDNTRSASKNPFNQNSGPEISNAITEYSIIEPSTEPKNQENPLSIQKEIAEEKKEEAQEEKTEHLPGVNMAESGEFDFDPEEENQIEDQNPSTKQEELREMPKGEIENKTQETNKSEVNDSKEKLHFQVQMGESITTSKFQMSTQMSETEEQSLSTPRQVLEQFTFDDIPIADSGFLGSSILRGPVEIPVVQKQANLNKISEVQEPNTSSEMSKGNSSSVQGSSIKANSIQVSSKFEEETKTNEPSRIEIKETPTPTPISDEETPLESNGFVFELAIKDDGLEIEAENKHTYRVYKCTLTKEIISESTNELFDSPEDIKDIFEDAFRNKETNVEVKINDSALMTITWKSKMGKTEKIRTLLSVQLRDQQESPLQTSQRLHRKASKNLKTPFEGMLGHMMRMILDYNHYLDEKLRETCQQIEELEINKNLGQQ